MAVVVINVAVLRALLSLRLLFDVVAVVVVMVVVFFGCSCCCCG